MNSKGANVIFTSIMIILLSVAAMIIIIGLVVPFFTSLREEINFNHNKENLILINQELLDLKTNDINTFKNLNLDVVDEIVFDATTNTVYIKQKISNNSFKNFKDANYGNLAIVKANGLMTFTLYLDGIFTLDKTIVINGNYTLRLTISDIINGIPVISITQYLGQVYLTISPKFNTFIGSLEIILTATPTDANIYYTTDSSEPTQESTLYTEPFTITDSTTIKARGYADGYTDSTIVSRNYVEIPLVDFNLFTISPDGNAFVINLAVTAISDPNDAIIYYTLDGNDPTETSIPYVSPITITDDNTILKLRAFKSGYSPSEIITRMFYEITGLLFYNKYDTNTTTDLSDKNAEIINKNISFDENGAHLDNNYENYLLIKNDWNGSYPSLNLGNNNFTLDAFVSADYRGQIFSKTGMFGGLSLSINDDGNVEFFFSAADQFWYLYAMTNDENYLYITEAGSDRIQKRRKDNWELVLIHGGPLASSSIDSYSDPDGIAVDDNFVYIADYLNDRLIKRYKSDFSYHSMLSNGAGSGSNQLYHPFGVAVDDNYIYVVDSYYHRVKKLDKTTFELIATLGGTAAGSGDYQFSSPRGIAVDDNYLYVTEIGYDRIKKYTKTDFTFVSKACGTTAGAGNDQLNNPYHMTVDENYIYIADTSNNRIMIRNKDENMTYYNKISSSGGYGDTTHIYYPYGVTVDENYIYNTEYYTHRLRKSKKSDLSFDSIYSNTSVTDESVIGPYGIVSDEEYLYYLDYSLHRLVKRRISDQKAVASVGGPFVKTVTTGFYSPAGLAIDENYLYIGNNSFSAINKYNKSDLSLVYTYQPGTATLRNPYGLVADGNYLYVTTNYTNMVKLYKIDISTTPWVIETSVGGAAGSGTDQFNAPYGVTVDDTYVYVADYSNHRIKKHLKSDLSYVSHLGISAYYNYFPNTLYNPIGVLYDNNYLYVVNNGYDTIRKFTTDFNYVSSIGFVAGYSNDSFYDPRGITISNGYMYITDFTLGRITKRDLKEFDANITFAGADTDFNFFYYPNSVDSDENYYYITNYNIDRIEKRNKSDYSLVTYLGGPYGLASTTQESRKYFFNDPNDIIVDGDYIYISDRSSPRVAKLNKSDLSYISQFGTGSYGSTTTQLYGPRQLAIYDNNLYVADFSNNRIMILDKNTMTYLTHFGTTGTGNDQFSGIYGVGVDENYIFTLEYYNNRIKKINKSDFTYITHIGGTSSGSGDDQFSSPLYLSLDENYIYVSDNLNYRIKKHLKSDLSFVSKIGSSGLGDDQFRTPFGIKYKDENTLLVADATNNRIHIRNPSDLSFVSMIDLSTYTNDGLYSPYGVAVDDDYLYISDFSNNRIVKKDKTDLSLVASVGNPISGSGDDQFYLPYGVAVDDDYIYINDSSNCRIVKRNKSDLSYVSKLSGGCGTGNTQIRYNYGIAVDDNYIYVTEGSYHRVKKFTKDTFTFVASIGGTASGKGDDQFTNPRGIAVYGDYIYVVDMGNHRIHKRNKDDLSLVQLYGLPVSGSSATDSFYEPVGVEVHDDILYIVDFRNNRIKVYDTNFNFLYKFGNAGWGQDQFLLPTDIAIDDEFVYVADQSNHRVVKRSRADLENIKNIPLTNFSSTWGYNSNLLTSNNIITTDSQIVLKRSGSDICIYINGVEDICENYSNTPTYFTYPEVNVHYGASATTTTYYLSENQNYYPWGVGNYGLSPGNGHLKYLRLFDTNLSDSDINALYQSYK